MNPNPDFPQLLGCVGLPSADGQTAELRIENDDDPPGPTFTVPIDRVKWLNLPHPEQFDTPEWAVIVEIARAEFKPRGIAVVPCRVVEIIVEVPGTSGPIRVSARPDNISRPMRPPR